MSLLTIDDLKCTRCGQCVKDCPTQIIRQEGTAVPFVTEESSCMHCQRCLAVCPTGALTYDGFRPEDSLPLGAGHVPTLEQMETLVRGRRSVRQYKRENVDPVLLDRLINDLSNVPSAVNNQGWQFSYIDDISVMDAFRNKSMNALKGALEAGQIPDHFEYLKMAVPAFFEQGGDIIFRGAPHVLIISMPKGQYEPTVDLSLALAYFELMAQSAGLGTTWCGMIKMAMMVCPELKQDFGIAESCQAYYPMLFGNPAVRYFRGVQRDQAAKRLRVTTIL